MHFNKLILGGGIAGLVTALFNDDCEIVTKENNVEFPLGPSLIHYNRENEYLLRKLGLSTATKKIKVGYVYKDKIYDVVTDEMHKEYLEKTRTFAQKSHKMSESFEAFTVSISELMKFLEEKFRKKTFYAEVVYINLSEKLVIVKVDNGGKVLISYDKMFSTIPLNAFIKLAEISNFEKTFALPITFVRTEMSNVQSYLEDYDYAYVMDDTEPFYRVSRVDEENAVLEFVGKAVPEKYKNAMRICRKCGKLKSVEKLPVIDDIEFVGRFGRWNDEILLQDVVRMWSNNELA